MQIVDIKGSLRSSSGTSGAKAVRKEGLIPAVIYGKGDAMHISVAVLDVRPLVYTPDFKLAKIDVDGQQVSCILKEVQAHPVTEEILHLDFLSLSEGHPVNVELPIRFKGVSPGVKAGGALMQLMRKVKVKATPENLVDELTVDISELKLGFSVRVKDIEISEGVQLLNNPTTPVASVEVPRALKSADAAEEGAEVETEGAVEEVAE